MKRAGKFWVPDEEQIQLEQLAAGGWQLDHLEAALKIVTKRHRVAVDGGAHVGSWTLRMAESFENVIAFEPSRENYECLEANVKEWRETHRYRESEIVLQRFGLGEEAALWGMGEDGKYSNGGNTGGRYLKADRDGTVNVRRLDSFKLKNCDFLKLDVEGFELFALRGARDTLERCHPVVMIEVKPRMAFRYGLGGTEAGDFLESLGAFKCGAVGSDHFYRWRKA